MKKIKFILFAFTALLVVVLVGLKISAATGDYTTYVYDLDFSKGVSIEKNMQLTVNPYVEGDETKTEVPSEAITFTYTNKDIKNTNITYLDGTTQIVNDKSVKGVKLNSSGYLKFSAKASWSAELVIGGGTIGDSVHVVSDANQEIEGVTVSGALTVTTTAEAANIDNNFAKDIIKIDNGVAGEMNIKRSKGEVFIADMILKVNIPNDAETCKVYFYNGDVLQEGLTKEIIVGNTVSAPDTVLQYPEGKIFAGWTANPETNELYDFTQPVNGELNLYAIWEDYSVDNPNVLDSALLDRWGQAYHQVTKHDKVNFTGTNYSITYNMNFISDGEFTSILKNTGSMNVANESNALIFEAKSSGTLIVEVKSGSSKENQNLECITVDNVAAISTDANIDNTGYKAVEFKITTPGTYYIGNTEGTVLYKSAKFVEDAELHQYENAGKTSIRYVCAIRNIPAEELANVVVTLKLTLEGVDTVNVNIPTVYTSVLGDNGFAAEANTYYMVYTITGLNVDAAYYGKTLTAQVVVTNGDSIVNSIVTTYTISNFTA